MAQPRRSMRIAERVTQTPVEAGPSGARGNTRKRSSSSSSEESTPSKKNRNTDELTSQTIIGSPLDPFPRRIVNVDDLDFNQSYVGRVTQVGHELPPRQKRWTHPGPEPLMDQTQVPKGWNSQEPDLDRDDIDGHIQRCLDRIDDNILPYIFEQRLVKWESKRTARNVEMARETPGLSWGVVKRLQNLALMRSHLQQSGDKYEQQSNIDAVERAYRSGALERHRGLVVYFSRGEQLCHPRPFDWDEFEAINKRYRGESSFWTEGLNDVHEPQFLGATLTLQYHQPSSLFYYWIAVRVPGTGYYTEIEFIHDTGASSAAIPRGDLDFICGPNRPTIPVMGAQSVVLADGSVVTYDIVELEMAVLKGEKRMSPYLRVPVLLKPDPNSHRLDGPFAQFAMYIASKPDGLGTIYMSSGNPSWRLGVNIPFRNRPDAVPALSGRLAVTAGTTVTMPALTPANAALPPRPGPAAHWGIP